MIACATSSAKFGSMKTRTALETILQPRRSRRREEADLRHAPSVRPIVPAAAAFRRCFANASLAIQICSALFFLSCSMPVLRGASGDENWDAGFGVPGVEGYISAMAAFRTELFVGGVFSRIGGVEATNVARWDGTNWSALGPGLGSIAEQRGVLALTMIEGDLFAGGAFRSSGTNPISGLAKWNGEAWVPIAGAGRNGLVSALASDGFNLYVGGVFTTIAGINASNVAKWDGTNWSPLGNGVHRWRIGVIEPLGKR